MEERDSILIKSVVRVFTVVITLLFLYAFFGNVYVDIVEREYFVRDNVLCNLLLLTGILTVLHILSQKGVSLPKLRRIHLTVFTCIYILAMTGYILLMQVKPDADQLQCVLAARGLLEGDYSMWKKGGYMEFHPHQWGFVWYLYLLFLPFGVGKVFLPQFMNLASLVVAAVFLSKNVYLLSGNRKLADYTYLLSLSFWPINGFVVYVYGILPGLACALTGCYFLLKCLKEKEASWKNGLLAFGMLSLACCLKSNYLLFFLPGCLVLLYQFFRERKKKILGVTVLGIGIYVATALLVSGLTVAVTRVPKEGIPLESYLLMGIQESPLGCGMYNGIHLSIYTTTGYDKTMARKVTWLLVEERLAELLDDPVYTAEFFARKIAGQWNEASFESMWISTYRPSFRGRPAWIWQLFYDGFLGSRLLKELMAGALLFFWFGVLLYGNYEKKLKTEKLLFPLIFMAAFLYHLLFEVKPQYALPYVYILIPYALAGYGSFMERGMEKKKNFCRSRWRPIVGVLGLTLILWMTPLKPLDRVLRLSYRQQEYTQYLEQIRAAALEGKIEEYFVERVHMVNRGE